MGYHIINLIDGKLEHRYVNSYDDLCYENTITDDTIIYQGEEQWKPCKVSESDLYKSFASDNFRVGMKAQQLFKKQANDYGLILEELDQKQESFRSYTSNVDKLIKRGDFLVRNFGNIEIDVKCRAFKRPYEKENEEFIFFDILDFEKHLNMQSFTKTPILIAVYERDNDNLSEVKGDKVYFISIDEIERNKALFKKFRKQFKIPVEYLNVGFEYVEQVFKTI
ncbi:hypothetical protein [Bergeyella sp. RCAD1439]|uniref:hypothetical protein n=1 Tax=Bergeyella anatis TaxID=3113737 RepID=UPI002A8DB1EA|nr:hypothetical protein [Riemerella anatipestifer]MEC5395967.1 hypothetical protein [Bergeyella sp. RCAD1439]